MDPNVVKIPSLTWFVENSGRYSSVKSSPAEQLLFLFFFYPKARPWFTLIAEAIMKSTGKLRKEGRGENARVFFPPLPLPYFKPSTSPLKSFFRLAKSLCQFQRPNRSHGKIHLLCRLQSYQILTDVCIEKVGSCPLPHAPPPLPPFHTNVCKVFGLCGAKSSHALNDHLLT